MVVHSITDKLGDGAADVMVSELTNNDGSQTNHVEFIKDALMSRRRALKKMDNLIRKATDLKDVTGAFKAINQSIMELSAVIPLTPLSSKGTMFEAGKMILENRKEILLKQHALTTGKKDDFITDCVQED